MPVPKTGALPLGDALRFGSNFLVLASYTTMRFYPKLAVLTNVLQM